MAEGNALKAMVTFFTIWQQEITQEDMDAMNRDFHLAPVVGALIGIVLLIETSLLAWVSLEGIGLSSMFVAAVILMTVYVGSRFLHFDGLADFGDGSIVAGTQEDHIRALKDTLLGAGGLGVALIVTLLNFSIYAMVSVVLLILIAPLVEIMVKNAQVAAAAFGIPGKGMAGRQVSETNMGSMWVSSLISVILSVVVGTIGAIVIGSLVPYSNIGVGDAIALAIIGTVVSIIMGYLMAHRANRVFGMVNGDILGATNEISRAVLALAMYIVMVI